MRVSFFESIIVLISLLAIDCINYVAKRSFWEGFADLILLGMLEWLNSLSIRIFNYIECIDF